MHKLEGEGNLCLQLGCNECCINMYVPLTKDEWEQIKSELQQRGIPYTIFEAQTPEEWKHQFPNVWQKLTGGAGTRVILSIYYTTQNGERKPHRHMIFAGPCPFLRPATVIVQNGILTETTKEESIPLPSNKQSRRLYLCDIYPTRPKACRDFEAGGPACLRLLLTLNPML